MKALSLRWAAALLVCVNLTASATVHYVSVNSTNATPPYTNWDTAATNIQDAVDSAADGEEVVVTNGVYATGGRAVDGIMTNRVAVDKAVTVRSVNGPNLTWIVGQGIGAGGTNNGDGAIRCVYVRNEAVLSGFTLTNGHTRTAGASYIEQSGGGTWCEASGVITNCIFTGNAAGWSGGGSCYGTLNNCTFIGNSVRYDGGGAASGTLNNCTLVGNYGTGASGGSLNNCTVVGNYAGGVTGGTLYNCIVYHNAGQNYIKCTFAYSCTTPLPPGIGNIDTDPLFMNTNGWTNLRLQSNSPCINAGKNAYAAGSTDLDGNPRVAGAKVDMGAYEFQGANLSGFTAWLWQYGLHIDGSADFSDPDGDGLNNWQEWRCGTDPTKAASALRLLPPEPSGSNILVQWESVSGINYFLERSTNLFAAPAFQPLATNLSGVSGTTSYQDTNPPPQSPVFYRIGVGD